MGLSAKQFRIFVVRPTLQRLNLWTAASEAILMGTAAHESGGFRFVDQITSTEAKDNTLGPAYGIFGIEPPTHDDLFSNFLRFHADLRARAIELRAMVPDPHTQLVTNLAYATAIARLIFYRAKPPLPQPDDIPGMADYWLAHYNKSRMPEKRALWIEHYRRFVVEA
jgi:hypothetical protein